MPKRHYDRNSDYPDHKKITLEDCDRNSIVLKPGEILKDLCGKEWVLGEIIGFGGFGVIHEVSDRCMRSKNKYVVKIEEHSNGPLFTEINCYLRIGKKEMVDEWTEKKKLSILGMPHYVASGSHIFEDIKYRFLVLPRYEKDLEAILEEKKKFNLKTVLLISRQILQVLEYIHERGYIHSDIKAANIMMSQVKSVKTKNTTLGDLSTYSKSPVADSKRRCKLRSGRVRKLTEVSRPVLRQRYDTRKVKCINYNIDHLFDNCSLFGSEDEEEETKAKIEKTAKTEMEEITRDQQGHPLDVFKRPPLLSNMPVKPILRKKTKKKKTQAALKWSMMLSDPEVLLKKVRDRKVENNDSPTVLDFDLEEMNPTPAMREVFKRYEEKKGLSPNSYGETDFGNIPEGYTPAMAAVRQKILELQEMEEAAKSFKKKTKRTRKNTKKSRGKDSNKVKQKACLPTRTYSLRG